MRITGRIQMNEYGRKQFGGNHPIEDIYDLYEWNYDGTWSIIYQAPNAWECQVFADSRGLYLGEGGGGTWGNHLKD